MSGGVWQWIYLGIGLNPLVGTYVVLNIGYMSHPEFSFGYDKIENLPNLVVRTTNRKVFSCPKTP